MATVTDSATEIEAERPSLWDRWTVPAIPVLAGMVILLAGVVFAIWSISDSRHDFEADLRRSTCEAQREFRGFFTGYLTAQVGTPVEQIAGFDELSPDAKELARQLAPVVDAGREQDQAFLSEFMIDFPIPVCPPPS